MDPEIENFVRFWLRSRYNLAEVDEVCSDLSHFSHWLASPPRKFLKIQFPEPEIEMEEATSEEANVLKVERQMETSSEKSLLVDNLNRTLDKYQDIPEDGIKAQKDNTDPRLTVAKNVVSLGAKKTVVDEDLAQEHGADADAATVIDGNMPAELWTVV